MQLSTDLAYNVARGLTVMSTLSPLWFLFYAQGHQVLSICGGPSCLSVGVLLPGGLAWSTVLMSSRPSSAVPDK